MRDSRGGVRAGDDSARLLGREVELETIAALVGRLPRGGGVLHVSGPAGIGKSPLVKAAAVAAEETGVVVLRGRGAQAEAHLPFAALHQLLRPLLSGLVELPPAHRAALGGAFGLTEEVGTTDGTTNRFFIALAALELIANAAAQQPVLVVADDVHWFDAPPRRDRVSSAVGSPRSPWRCC